MRLRRLRRLSVALGAASLLFPAGLTRAGAERPCVEFEIFEGARVNTLIRQFTVLEDPYSPLGESGMQLARMVQLDALYSQIGFGPLGCIFLRVRPGDSERCSNNYILDRARTMSQPERGILLLSGQFQEFEGQVFLLTRLEFERKEVDESITLSSVTAGEEGVEFLGDLPVRTVSFSPRQFSLEQLQALAQRGQRPLTIYPRPEARGEGRTMDLQQLQNFSYSVSDVRRGWMRIVPTRGGRAGWVEIPEGLGPTRLRELLPELAVVQATAIYLQTRSAGGELAPARRQRNLRAFEGLLEEFRERAQPGGDQRAVGMLEAMLGMLRLDSAAPGDSTALLDATEHFERAAGALPSNGAALALRDFSRILGEAQTDATTKAEAMEQSLLRQMKLDPGNAAARANLERLYLQRESLGAPLQLQQKLPQLRTKLNADPKVQARIKKN